ncbi:hypothetical protein [Clostridium sp.]|uniref:hypothetical protein n=1 Tax=Clostridium sp. TaxID=1506 RepID=UPI002609C840|nr:hypothetical protein [Clostridium sp.]
MNKIRLPRIDERKKVCVICEGYEEYEYLEKIKELNVWDSKYDIYLENATGNGNVFARYQDKYQNGSFDIILIFCDTEKKPYEQYIDIKRKVCEFHGLELGNKVINEIIYFANPCTMQIIIMHWKEVMLTSNSKKVNAPIIEESIGVSCYKGKAEHRKALFEGITVENYYSMKTRIENLGQDDTQKGSSNFIKFIKYLSSDDVSWITDINKIIEE